MRIQVRDGSLVEFVYESQAEGEIPAAALMRLERQCWAHNTRSGITGELRHEKGRFSQVIEGAWPDVMALASRILTDVRHSAIAIRSFRPIRSRRFSSWQAVGLTPAGAVGSECVTVSGNVTRMPSREVAPAPRPAAATAEQATRGG